MVMMAAVFIQKEQFMFQNYQDNPRDLAASMLSPSCYLSPVD